MATIEKLCEKYRSDKTPSIAHSYAPYYDKIFKGIKVDKLLEIGIGYPDLMKHVDGYITGASLYVWRDYFPKAKIYAIDNREDVLINKDRIKSLLADQTDSNKLEEIGNKYGKFDIIIDDGSHYKDDQIISAKALVPFLAKDGIYVIEDVKLMWLDEILENIPYKCEVIDFYPGSHDNRLIIIYENNLMPASAGLV